MGYRITPLDKNAFAELVGASDAELARHGAVRMVVDTKPGYPCRVTLADAEVGETVLLVNHEHLPVDSPYRSSYAIFVREHASQCPPVDNAIPESLAIRLLSIRAFDDAGLLINADVVHGSECEAVILRLLDSPRAAYLHVHNAKPGCYAARVDRLA